MEVIKKMNEEQTFERNRIGCPIHKRQEKVSRVEIGKEIRGYRLIETHARRKGEIIGVDEYIRLFFSSLEGELNLKAITRPMRIAKYRLCEWVHPIQKIDLDGNKTGDMETGRGCILVLDEIDFVPIYEKCTECHRYLANQEEHYEKELDYLCIECFCEQTEQNDLNIWS